MLALALTLQVGAVVGCLTLVGRTRDRRLWVAVLLTTSILAWMTSEWQPAIADLQPTRLVIISLLCVGVVAVLFHFYDESTRLSLQSAYFERLFEQSPEAIVLLDNQDRAVRVNSEFTRLFGFERAEVIGHRINDLIVPDDRQEEGLRLTTTVAGGHAVSIDSTVRRRRDGSFVDVSILGTPVWIRGGQAAVYAIYRDVSGQKAAESALRQSEEKYRTLLDNIQDGFYELSLEGDITAFNRALSDLLGYQGDLTNVNVREFTDQENASKLQTLFNWVKQRGRSAGLVEWEFIRKDGEIRSVEGSIAPVFSPDRSVKGFRGIVRDMTERHHAEAVLRQQWAAIEASLDGMAITGPDGRFEYVNDAYLAMYGFASAAELVGRSWESVHTEQERIRFRDEVIPIVLGQGHWRGEAIGQRTDGTTFAQEISFTRLDNNGFTAVVRDITERKEALQALRESEERYALAAQGANDGLWDWNLRTDEVYYSNRWQSMIGFAEGEFGSRPDDWLGRVHAYDVEQLRKAINDHISGESSALECEYRIKHKDGSYRWVLCRGIAQFDRDGTPTRVSGSQSDITERKLAEEQLQHDALHDALTGLPNRNLITDRIAHALDRVQRRGDYLFAVLFLDLDRFKIINDSLGHGTGDRLLITTAQRLAQCVRPEDSVGRLGGDEFVVLLDGVDSAEEATTIADRIQDSLSRPVLISGREIYTSASIGIALSSRDYTTPDDVLRDADIAMYQAKSLGKSRHEMFDTNMHDTVMQRLTMESDLRRALELEQMVLAYQPIFSVEDRRVVALEALLRWHHPERGVIPPDEFMPVAEETGLIVPLGYWAMETACQAMTRWLASVEQPLDLRMHINLSGRQFRDGALLTRVRGIVEDAGLEPQHLGLEISEGVVMEDASTAIRTLEKLRSTRIRLHIDDFGTGYSSLNYLHRFPIDALKVDRSFVSNMGTSGENTATVQSIVSLGRELGLEVVAEGVETEPQLDYLACIGCSHAQGHLFSAPLTVDDEAMVAYLLEHAVTPAPSP